MVSTIDCEWRGDQLRVLRRRLGALRTLTGSPGVALGPTDNTHCTKLPAMCIAGTDLLVKHQQAIVVRSPFCVFDAPASTISANQGSSVRRAPATT